MEAWVVEGGGRRSADSFLILRRAQERDRRRPQKNLEKRKQKGRRKGGNRRRWRRGGGGGDSHLSICGAGCDEKGRPRRRKKGKDAGCCTVAKLLQYAPKIWALLEKVALPEVEVQFLRYVAKTIFPK